MRKKKMEPNLHTYFYFVLHHDECGFNRKTKTIENQLLYLIAWMMLQNSVMWHPFSVCCLFIVHKNSHICDTQKTYRYCTDNISA